MLIAHLPAGYLLADGLHHDFLFHWPLFWSALALVLWLPARIAGWRTAQRCIGVGLVSLLLHMVLDSIAGHVKWLAPFSDRAVNLVEIPASYDWWVWSFTHHWLFVVELAIVLCAAITFRRRAMKKAPGGALS